MMWNGYFGQGAGWEGWLTPMFMIVFVVAIVIAIVYFVRYVGQPQAATMQTVPPQQVVMAAPAAPTAHTALAAESPQDILKRRYAAGEIEREEYLQKLGDL